MPRSKKAIFFTLISVLIVTMFVLYFKLQADIPMKSKLPIAESRISSMNDFVRSFEEVYAQRALYGMSHNALNFMFLYLNQTNSGPLITKKFFFRNASEAFQMAVNESYLPIITDEGQLVKMQIYGMENMQFWMGKLANTTRKELGADFNFTIYDIHLEQDYETGPWKVRAVMRIGYMINSSGIAKWERYPPPITAEFDVSDFMDPYIAVMSHGYLNRKINISRVNTRLIDDAQFVKLVESGSYIFENYSAPSFLFRFEGNTSPSYCCGMESFVYPGIVYEDPDTADDVYPDSYLDFQFWRGRCYREMDDPEAYILNYERALWVPENIYPGFDYIKLDSYHRFNVYPNIMPLGNSYLLLEEYERKYPLQPTGDRTFNIKTTEECSPVAGYDNPDGVV